MINIKFILIPLLAITILMSPLAHAASTSTIATSTTTSTPVVATSTPVLSTTAGNTSLGPNIFASNYYVSTAFGNGMTLSLKIVGFLSAVLGLFLLGGRRLITRSY